MSVGYIKSLVRIAEKISANSIMQMVSDNELSGSVKFAVFEKIQKGYKADAIRLIVKALDPAFN
jgi:hypothetical protein